MEFFFNLFKKNKDKHTPYILRQQKNRPKKYGIKHYRSYIIHNYNFVYEKPQYRFLEKYDDSNNVFYGDIFKEENETSFNLNEVIIDTDFEILFPNKYISQVNERLKLYTELSTIKNKVELNKFKIELIDKYGKLPNQVKDL